MAVCSVRRMKADGAGLGATQTIRAALGVDPKRNKRKLIEQTEDSSERTEDFAPRAMEHENRQNEHPKNDELRDVRPNRRPPGEDALDEPGNRYFEPGSWANAADEQGMRASKKIGHGQD